MIGRTLGHYRILEKIGQGGMGEVFLAEDASLHRKVALKFLPSEMQQDDTARKRFIREARSAAALDHPYICHINEVGESEGQAFIAMEYVEGQSLKERIAAGPTGRSPLPVDEALQITIEVAEALEAAHGKGIVHRDIKPGNIMLTRTGHAKVMDFGLAKQTGAGGGVDTEEETVTALTHSRWPAVAAAALALFILAGILVGLDVGGLQGWMAGRMGIPARAVRLAVLPFANLTGDPEQEYLSDGLTQEMIAQLGALHPQSLSVIARTSVMRYKKTEKPIDQIGQELGVGYILEGSARRDGGRIRITAELIQVQDQTQLWAETYEREMAGILALQAEVARKVAKTLALKLLPAEQARLANVRTVNPEAYDAYLKGLKLSYGFTSGDLDAALKHFEMAMERDSNYALAYVGVSIVWIYRQQLGFTPPHEAAPKAKVAALKALELDNTLMEAHYALALLYAWTDWNWPAAESSFKRAIELNPNFPDARALYSHYLNMMHRPDEAMAQIERALALDPFHPLFQSLYAVDLVFMRRYDDAVAAARHAPDNPVALQAVWFARSLQGMQQETLEAAKAYLKG